MTSGEKAALKARYLALPDMAKAQLLAALILSLLDIKPEILEKLIAVFEKPKEMN